MAVLKCNCGKSEMGFKYLKEGTFQNDCCPPQIEAETISEAYENNSVYIVPQVVAEVTKDEKPEIESLAEIGKKNKSEIQTIAEDLSIDVKKYNTKNKMLIKMAELLNKKK